MDCHPNLSTCSKKSGVSTKSVAAPLKFLMKSSVMTWVTEQATKPPSNVFANLEFPDVICKLGDRNVICGRLKFSGGWTSKYQN